MPKLHVVRHEVTQPLDQSYRLIPLTQGQNAIVDVEDFEWLSQWNWCARRKPSTGKFYAGRGVRIKNKAQIIAMHAVILEFPGGDHKNRNTLDNRRENLRKCTLAQNGRNRGRQRNNKSGFKGVCWDGGWRATIRINGKIKHLGRFESPKDAARAYNEAAKKHYGEFAYLNEIPKS